MDEWKKVCVSKYIWYLHVCMASYLSYLSCGMHTNTRVLQKNMDVFFLGKECCCKFDNVWHNQSHWCFLPRTLLWAAILSAQTHMGKLGHGKLKIMTEKKITCCNSLTGWPARATVMSSEWSWVAGSMGRLYLAGMAAFKVSASPGKGQRADPTWSTPTVRRHPSPNLELPKRMNTLPLGFLTWGVWCRCQYRRSSLFPAYSKWSYCYHYMIS